MSVKAAQERRPMIWRQRAACLLQAGLEQVNNDDDYRTEEILDFIREQQHETITLVSAALAALRIEEGELSEGELDGWFGNDNEACICPVELLERGGYRGTCTVHGLNIEEAP